MNWYSIFYWLSVADQVKKFFDSASDTFTTFAIISFIGWVACYIWRACAISEANVYHDKSIEEDSDVKVATTVKNMFGKVMYTSLVLSLITWSCWIFLPTKKDSLIIIAGGAVGNFITKDTSAKQIPAEVMTLLRDKLRSEIRDVHLKDVISTDSLASKSKEELIEIIKKGKQ